MDVLFLCGMYPQPYKEEIFNNSKKGYQFAAQNLQEAIVEGFLQNRVNLSIVTIPFLSTFPLGYKKPLIKFGPSKFKGEIQIECATYLNVPFFQGFGNTASKKVMNWSQSRDSGVKHIIVYSLSKNLMELALKAKRNFRNIKLSIIVPDLPEFFGTNFIDTALGLKEKRTDYIYNNIELFDQFIILSEAMAAALKIEKKPYVVIEGIYNPESTRPLETENETTIKTILYTGALNLKYGFETLLEAFSLCESPSYRLIFCGDGNAKNLIIQKSLEDKRIKYLGKMPPEKIFSLQKNADLLINPRTPEGEYTKYSFPSKTMEYFASGTPVLMYKLPGIPPEYFDHCFIMNDTSSLALSKKIQEIFSLPTPELNRIGENASKFIRENKNPKKQVEKIINLMNKV